MTRSDSGRPRHHAHGPELADRSAAAHAHEQSRSRGRRAPRGSRRLRRHRPRGAQLGDATTASSRRCDARGRPRRCSSSPASPSACSRPIAMRRACCIANSNLVPHWATWEHFHELDRKGLMMYGQMTAGSWIYIGSQGIVQGTYETFVEMGRQHYGGDSRRPLDPHRRSRRHGRRAAARRDDGGRVVLAVECQPSRIDMRLRTALPRRPGRRASTRRSRSIDASAAVGRAASRSALLGNAAEVFPELGAARRASRRGHRSDLGARSGERLSARRAGRSSNGSSGAVSDPSRRGRARRKRSMAVHVAAMLDFKDAGVPTFDYGNNIRQMAKDEGVARRVRHSRASCRPTSGRCSAAASGRSAGRRCRAIPKTSTRPMRR